MVDRAGQSVNWWRALGWVLSLAAIVFVARWLLRVDHHVWTLFRTFHAGTAVASLLIFQTWFALRFLGWNIISRWYGLTGSTSSNVKMWTLSELLRYIPGNVWSFAARFRGARDRGATPSGAGVALVLEAMNLIMGAAIVAAWLWRPIWWWLWLTAALVFVIGLPTGLTRVARWRKWEQHHRLSLRQSSLLLALYVLVWLSYGLAQSIIITAVPGLSLPAMPILIGANVTAWLIGYLSFITPMGLGVREVAFASLLQPSLSAGLASLLAVMTRVWLIICELVFLSFVMIFSRRR